MPIRFQVDGDFYDHPKAIDLSDAATALWVRAGSYSAAKLSDGFIAEAALRLLSRCPEEAAGELVTRGLWRRVKGGFKFHQWSDRNLLRARVEAEKKADRLRKQQVRQTTKQNPKPQAESHIVRPDSGPDSNRNPDGVRPLSVSVSVSESVSGSGRGAGPSPNARSAVDPEPPPRCPNHIDNPDPPPCGPCAEARKTHARWTAARAVRLAQAPKCVKHRGQIAGNCGLCRADAIAAESTEGATR